MAKQTAVEWFKTPKTLSEIYQQTGMIFSFISSPENGSKMCHGWVKCRDFLHDAVLSQLTNSSCSIYGFTFNPDINPIIDIRRMRMIVSKDGLKVDDVDKFRTKMQSGLKLVNHFEQYARVSLSKLQELNPKGSNKESVFLFIGPRMWMTSPFLISMYSFLIRLGDKNIEFETVEDLKNQFKFLYDKYIDGKLTDNDANYLGSNWDKMHLIIKNRTKLFPKKNGMHDIFYAGFRTESFHNSGGIRSLSLFQTPDIDLNNRIKELIAYEKTANKN